MEYNMQESNIKVIDSIMGSGKTQGMFKYIREYPNKKYLYISPLLSEVGDGNKNMDGRIQQALPELNFIAPRNKGRGKANTLKNLIREGKNVASTHSLFKQFDIELVDLLLEQDYVLIIDEAVDCIKKYTGVKKGDIKILSDSKAIDVDPRTGRVSWLGDGLEDDHKYTEVRELSRLGNLFKYGEKFLIWEYSDRLLKGLSEVYIMTYMFRGSVMYSWLTINEVPWCYADNAKFDLKCSKAIKESIKDNIEFIYSPKLKRLRKDPSFTPRTFSWNKYNQASYTELKEIKKVFESVVKRCGAKTGDVFWTTYKGVERKDEDEGNDYIKNVISGNGFSRAKSIEDDEGNVVKKIEPFLAYNTKATNDYQDYWLVLYGVNLNKKPEELNYIKDRCDIEFDNDTYALSEMVQFVWRSRIRKGEPIKLFILSERMEKLFKEWLYS